MVDCTLSSWLARAAVEPTFETMLAATFDSDIWPPPKNPFDATRVSSIELRLSPLLPLVVDTANASPDSGVPVTWVVQPFKLMSAPEV